MGFNRLLQVDRRHYSYPVFYYCGSGCYSRNTDSICYPGCYFLAYIPKAYKGRWARCIACRVSLVDAVAQALCLQMASTRLAKHCDLYYEIDLILEFFLLFFFFFI